MIHRELLIAGEFVGPSDLKPDQFAEIRSPYDDHVVGHTVVAGIAEAESAIEAAVSALQSWRFSTVDERQSLLQTIAADVRANRKALADLLVEEIGKPIVWAEGEVARLALTFDLAAKELNTWDRRALPLDFDARGEDYRCFVQRFPVGPVLAIVPYNWPYNLAAHKIAPALAVGCSVILKASPLAPLSTLTLAKLIHEAGCPPGVLNSLNCDAATSERLATDSRIPAVSFTGSVSVGWHLKELLPEKKVTLELGGDASAIICNTADVDRAVDRLVASAYGYAGQVCISAQHALVEESVYEPLRSKLIELSEACPFGDPALRETVCGPLISSAAADRVMDWIAEAEASGARVIAGGNRIGNIIEPTLLESVPPTVRLGCEEVFGPVLTLEPVQSLDAAIARVNASRYGIHASLFTKNRDDVERAFESLEVGGLIVNDFPTLRFDNMPYGGVKRSGFGREGVRSAMLEFSEPKVLLERKTDWEKGVSR